MFKYKDPFSQNIVEFALVKIEDLEIPDIQRDFSPYLASKIATSIQVVGYFTTPIIVVKHNGKLLVVDGQHRVKASEALGLKEVPAVIIEDPKVLQSIMRLNTEKAPNIKDQSVQAYKIYLDIYTRQKEAPEEVVYNSIPDAYLATAGFALEMNPSFSPGVTAILRKVDYFLDTPLKEAIEVREDRARKLLELFDLISEKEVELAEKKITKKQIITKALPCKRGSLSLLEFDELAEGLKANIKALTPDDF